MPADEGFAGAMSDHGTDTDDTDLLYGVDERPRSARDTVLYSLQWLATLFYGVVWGYAIVGIGLGFEGAELTTYMAAIVLVTAISTLTQAVIGHRFAMVSGPNIIPSLAIVAAATAGGEDHALHAFTAQAIGGAIVLALAVFGVLDLIRHLWSPLILGSMVLVIGLAIASAGVDLLATDGFGWPFAAGVLLALGATVMAIRSRGVLATIPILLIVTVGYAVFMIGGDFAWDRVSDPALAVWPSVLPYGTGWPPFELIAIMTVVNLMSALNLYGNVMGYAEVVGETVGRTRMRRSFTLLGSVEMVLPGLLGAPATVPYGENIGIVAVTRIAARTFVVIASAVFVLFAFVGPLVGLMAAMPEEVAGAVLLGVASTAIGVGIQMITSAPEFARREQALVGFSVFLALGLSTLPDDAWDGVPRVVTTVFSNPIVAVILFVVFFEQIALRRRAPTSEIDHERSAP